MHIRSLFSGIFFRPNTAAVTRAATHAQRE